MKTKLLILVTITLTSAFDVHAGSATWLSHPATRDWNTADNWSPPTVPNGPSDTATFSNTSKATVSISNTGITVASAIFDSTASRYTITNDFTMSIVGQGILNNSRKLQKFVVRSSSGVIFKGNATAGTLTQFTMRGADRSDGFGGGTFFYDQSSADHAAFIINGPEAQFTFDTLVNFYGQATAANATFSVRDTEHAGFGKASLGFFETSSGGNAVITAEGGAVESFGGDVTFSDSSTAANATCVANGGGAAGALGGTVRFESSATAEQATLIANGGSNGGEGA